MKRTNKQNKAIHKWFTMIAEQLNSAGLDMRKTLKEEIEIPWTGKSAKEFLWRPIQAAMYQTNSTTELDTKELTKVADTLQRHLASRLGQDIRFPSLEEVMLRDLYKDIDNLNQ